MSWPGDDALEALASRFREGSLPTSEWTHHAHLAVGAWHVHRYGAFEALERLRSGIARLNESHGSSNTDDAGYHETITRAYVVLIADQRGRLARDAGAGDLARTILASPLAAKDALLAHYRKERLMSREARRAWLDPDLAPLPQPAASEVAGLAEELGAT